MHAPLKLAPRGCRRGIIGDGSRFGERGSTAGEQFVLHNGVEQIPEVSCHLALARRQACIGCVRQLVQVVADTLELIDERQRQGRVVGGDHDFAVLDQTRAQP